MDIIERLFELQDIEYGDFSAKLAPNIPRESCIGVRVPALRKLARELMKEPELEVFLNDLPHRYYEENMLHSILLSQWKDYEETVEKVQAFLPYVDNWAVCDTLRPKVFKKNLDKVIRKVYEWIDSPKTYTCRFGIGMLMTFFLDDAFKPEYLELPARVKSDEYYVNMMIAWYFATALAKQWDATIPYIEEHRMDKWVNNKSIQKARESYRITPEQKEYLATLRL